jgi:hypothetical protein
MFGVAFGAGFGYAAYTAGMDGPLTALVVLLVVGIAGAWLAGRRFSQQQWQMQMQEQHQEQVQHQLQQVIIQTGKAGPPAVAGAAAHDAVALDHHSESSTSSTPSTRALPPAQFTGNRTVWGITLPAEARRQGGQTDAGDW